MRNLFLLCIVILFRACDAEVPEDNPVQRGPLKFNIDNRSNHYYPEDAIAIFSDKISEMLVVIQFEKEELSSGSLKFIFFDNHLYRVFLYDKNGTNYQSADFNPLKWFNVSNYKYDDKENTISFDYDGTLFEVSHNSIKTDAKSVSIKGKVNIKNVLIDSKKKPYYKSKASFTSDDLSFYTIESNWEKNKSEKVYRYNYFTNNGYNLTFVVNENLFAFGASPMTVHFDTEATENYILFRKFVGKPRANGLFKIRDEDWTRLPCKGSFTIENTFFYENADGKFNVEIQEENNKIHIIDNGTFIFKK